MALTKSEWRRTLLAARAAISEEQRRASGAALVARLRDLVFFTEARTILGYVALGAEVDPAPLCAVRSEDPRPIFVPGTAHSRWAALDGCGGGATREVSVGALELPLIVLVPGVGFDASGMRLGRGAGWYDRTLPELRARGHRVHVIGLAFEAQVVPVLPSDPWDQRVDVVVTEHRVLAVAAPAIGQSVAGSS